MVKTCCAPNCRNKSKASGISFFCFPKAEEQRQEWIRRVRKANFHPTRHTVLCSDHFSSDCFLNESVPEFLQIIGLEQRPARRRLKNGALPTLFKLTSNGWAEGHGEEEDADVREEEGLGEESEEEGEERFVIQMDVAEEETRQPEPGLGTAQNPSSLMDYPSHGLSPVFPRDLTAVPALAVNHVDEQGDNTHNSDNVPAPRSLLTQPRPGAGSCTSRGDHWRSAAEQTEEDCVEEEHQKTERPPDTEHTSISAKTDMGEEGLAEEGHHGRAENSGCEGQHGEDEGTGEEEPLFTIQSVCTLSKSGLGEFSTEQRGNQEQPPPDCGLPCSGRDAGSPDESSQDKKRRLSRKSPPSRKSSPGSTGFTLPFPPTSGSQSGPVLCRIDPAFCHFQPVFQVPFASSPTFFHKTADSMVAESDKAIPGPAHSSGDAECPVIKREDADTSQLTLQPLSDPPSPKSSPTCHLPCCTGRTGSSDSNKPAHVKQEVTQADYPSSSRPREGVPDPQRKPTASKPSPGKTPYRSAPVSFRGGGSNKKGNSLLSVDSGVPYRSEPITIVHTSDGKGTVPYRSEPIRKLPLCLALPPQGSAVVGSKGKARSGDTPELDLTKNAYATSRKRTATSVSAGKTPGTGKGVGEHAGHSRPVSTKCPVTFAVTTSKKKVDILSSHLAPVPLTSTNSGVAGKLSEGAIYIRRDHVMSDLVDVLRHSAHRLHRATVFRLCCNVSGRPPPSPSPADTLTPSSIAGVAAEGRRENWERVEHKRLFSLFWEECMGVYFDGHLQKVPKANSPAASCEVPYMLGKALRHGLVLCGYWPVCLSPACAVTIFTGEKCSPPLFRDSLLNTMFQYEVQALQALEDSAREGGARFQETRRERRVGVVVEAYGGTQCQVPAEPEEVPAFVSELAAFYLYCQPFWWLREMRRGFLSITEHTRADQNYLTAMTEGEVVDMYRTLLPTPHALLPRLSFRQADGKGPVLPSLQNFLERCLLRLSPQETAHLTRLWSDADCLLDDCYHVTFSSSSTTATPGSACKAPPFFLPSSNTLVLSSAGSLSFEHFEVMFRQLLRQNVCKK